MSPLLPLLLLSLAAPGSSALVEAEKAFQELDFEKSERLFKKALNGPANQQERLNQWKGLGLSQAFQGQSKEAIESFMKMLLIDSAASVDASMGPKISSPFEAARDGLAGKRNQLDLERSENGAVSTVLVEAVPLAHQVVLHARIKGANRYQTANARANRRATLNFPPGEELEAFAEAKDARGGVVYLAGSERAPVALPGAGKGQGEPVGAVAAVIEPQVVADPAPPVVVPAVASAVEQARHPPNASAAGGLRQRWPLLVGIGLAVGAGIAVGAVVSQPPKLSLPPADQTGRLP